MRIVLTLILSIIQFSLFSQNRVDSLLDVLSGAENKAEIYNLLSEATLEDSLELSFEYAQKAFVLSIKEKNLNQKGAAYFNIAEVYSYQYQLDSTKHYYLLAYEIFIKTNDNYNISYTLNNLGWLANNYCEYEDAINYYTESLDYLDKEKHIDDLSHIYVNIGNAHFQMGKYETAINYHRKSIAIAKSINYQPIIPYAYSGIGLAYKYLSKYDSAIVYYKFTLEIDKEAGDKHKLAIDYSNIGALHLQLKQYEQALEYFNDALKIHKEHCSKNDLSITLNNIGNVYKEQGKYELALDYFNQALVIDTITGIKLNISTRYNNIGEIYAKKADYQKAFDYYNKSLVLNQKMGINHNIAINLHNIGELYLNTGKYDKSQTYFEQGLQLADSLNATSIVIEYLSSLSELYKFSGNYKKALIYHLRYSDLKDSIFKEKNQIALADMKTKYDLEKREKKIALLNNENEYQKLKVNSFRSKIIYLIVGLIIFSVLTTLLILQYLYKNRAYNKLAERSKEYLDNENQLNKLILNPKIYKSVKKGQEQEKKQKRNSVGSKHIKLAQKLQIYFEEEKPYLNQNITQKDIADHLNTNPKYISQVINANFDKNFSTFVNEYRIKLALKYLANDVRKQYSIEGISKKVGFKSKSAFNIAFKKMTGITPSFYIKSLKKEKIFYI
jgi:tetratricopeptide (TPR) repeat protein